VLEEGEVTVTGKLPQVANFALKVYTGKDGNLLHSSYVSAQAYISQSFPALRCLKKLVETLCGHKYDGHSRLSTAADNNWKLNDLPR